MVLEPVKNVGSIQKQSIQTSAKETKSSLDVKEVNLEETVKRVEESEAVKVDDQTNAANSQNDWQQNQEQIKKALEKIHKSLPNSEAIFSIHDGTNRVTIKIIDKETKEVIKEYPPEKTLDMITKVWELAGMMVDEKR